MNKKLKLWELDRVSNEEFKAQEKFPIIVILDEIRSLSNVGSVFRTCDAFNVEKVYLCGITPQPPHRDIQKTALGATETVDWEHRESTVELVKELKEKGVRICSIEQAEETLSLEQVSGIENDQFALVFGNEVNGVDQAVVDESDYVIEVPQFGTKHSLNIAVCAGIVIWEFSKKSFT
jgi:tRNA G18 (ribose-2'-O)-methylase SpoU